MYRAPVACRRATRRASHGRARRTSFCTHNNTTKTMRCTLQTCSSFLFWFLLRCSAIVPYVCFFFYIYSGRFDFLHLGHIRALEAAAALGDFLLVGLVHSRPHRSPPTALTLGERAVSLLSCKYVDDVALDVPSSPFPEMLEAMGVAVVVRCEGHPDFAALTAATDWGAVEAASDAEVRTLDLSWNDFSTETIVRRVEALRELQQQEEKEQRPTRSRMLHAQHQQQEEHVTEQRFDAGFADLVAYK